MSKQQPTNINAYRAEATEALARAAAAEQEANAAVEAYVAQGGDEADVRPELAKKAEGGDSAAESKPEEPVKLPDSFEVGDDKYEALRNKDGKIYKYTLNGEGIKKAEYQEAHDNQTEDE